MRGATKTKTHTGARNFPLVATPPKKVALTYQGVVVVPTNDLGFTQRVKQA